MLTPENAGCPRCFAPLSEQTMIVTSLEVGDVEIKDGKAVMGPSSDIVSPSNIEFECEICGMVYRQMEPRNAHEMAQFEVTRQAFMELLVTTYGRDEHLWWLLSEQEQNERNKKS